MTMSQATARGMARTLGIPDTTTLTPDLLIAALQEVLEERRATNTIPPGSVAIPASELADLEAQAYAPVDLAIAEGKISADNRAGWIREYELRPAETLEYFASAPVFFAPGNSI
jgi:hypothetical protein